MIRDGIRLPSKHLLWMLITLVPYIVSTVVPYAPYYDRGEYWKAWAIWSCGTWSFNTFGYSISSHFWIIKMLGLKWDLRNWRLCILPSLMSSVVVEIPHLAYGLTLKWPNVPLVPAMSGGVLYNVVQPLCCYLALPKEMKEEKGFLMNKFIWAMAPAALIDMFWFATVAYYFAMSQTPEVFRILVVIIFRLFAVVYIGMGVKLIHRAVKVNGGDETLIAGACAKFSIDAAFEVHVFFTMHDIESWITLGLCIAFDYICLSVELLHEEESTLDAFFALLNRILTALTAKKKPKDVAVTHQTQGIEKTARMADGDGEPGTKLGTEKKKTHELSKSLLSLQGKNMTPSRIFHYVMAIHARLYATVIVSLLLPIWFYGPNKAWYFDFPEHVMTGSIEKMYIATGAAVVHYILAGLILRKTKGININNIFLDMLDEAWLPLTIGYALAPVYPTSQIGREWSTIYYFRTMMVAH